MVKMNFCQESELQHSKMTPKMLPLTSEISCRWYFFYSFVLMERGNQTCNAMVLLFIPAVQVESYCSMAYEIGEKTFLICVFCFPNADQVNLTFVFSK